MGKVKDMRGKRLGYLEVPKDAEPEMHGGHAYWPATCRYNDCGRVKMVRGTKMRGRRIVSCGCMRADPEVRSAVRRGYDHADEALDEAFESQRASRMEAEMEEAEGEARQRQIASLEQAAPAPNEQDDETVAPEQQAEIEEYDFFLGAPFEVLPTDVPEEPEEAPAEQTSDDTDDFI